MLNSTVKNSIEHVKSVCVVPQRRSRVSMIDCLSCAQSSNDVLTARDIWRTVEVLPEITGGLSESLRVE